MRCSNQLAGVLSEGLSQLVGLRDLALDGNQLTQLPESIHLLANLETLKLENNQLRALPVEIGALCWPMTRETLVIRAN